MKVMHLTRVLDVTKVHTNLVHHLRVTEVIDVTKVHTNLVPHLRVMHVTREC